MAVLPVRSMGGRCIAAAMAAATVFSAAVPNKTTSASNSSINRLATAANRSGGQHFAEPYEAPAPIATRNVCGRTPAASMYAPARALEFDGTASEMDLSPVKPLNAPGAPQQFKIIKLLVRWYFARFRNAHGFREKQAAAIARITDALRDARPPSQPRRIKSILQEQRHVELLRAKLPGKAFPPGQAGMRTAGVIRNQLIADLLVAINVRDVRSGNDGDVCTGEAVPDGAQRRQRHNGIANPIRGPDQNFHA